MESLHALNHQIAWKADSTEHRLEGVIGKFGRCIDPALMVFPP
jgi:hypothetical protein